MIAPPKQQACQIVELTPALLPGAIAANEATFKGTDMPRRSLSASLQPELEYGRPDTASITFRQYWVTIDENGKVVGTIGFYGEQDDEAEADWVNWFCVVPEQRGQGLGRQLLKFLIERAIERGKPSLRLWTTDGENEKASQPLYESLGFKIFKSEPSDDPTYSQKLYRQKQLRLPA